MMLQWLLAPLFLCCATLQAAGPVVHVFFAERFFETFPKYNEEEKKRFILGTLFPDIRYISKISREQTHDYDVTLQEILDEPSPFMAGHMFHSWIDHQRDEYVLADKIYDRLPNKLSETQKPSFIKVIEDEILLEKIDADMCCDLLETIDEEELQHGVTKLDVERWHAFLQFFFKTSPKTTITLLSLIDPSKNHPSGKNLDLWTSLVTPVVNSDVGQNHTKNLVDHILQKMHAFQQTTNEGETP